MVPIATVRAAEYHGIVNLVIIPELMHASIPQKVAC